MLRKRLPKWLQTTAQERALLIKLGEAVGRDPIPDHDRAVQLLSPLGHQGQWHLWPKCRKV